VEKKFFSPSATGNNIWEQRRRKTKKSSPLKLFGVRLNTVCTFVPLNPFTRSVRDGSYTTAQVQIRNSSVELIPLVSVVLQVRRIELQWHGWPESSPISSLSGLPRPLPTAARLTRCRRSSDARGRPRSSSPQHDFPEMPSRRKIAGPAPLLRVLCDCR
jgi:hypothetical protein